MLRVSIFASVLLLAACASTEGERAPAEGDRDCFRSGSVSGYNVIDRNTLEVRVGASRRYILTTNWPTTNLDFSQSIAIRSASGFICTGNGLGVEIIGGQPSSTYPVRSIARAPESTPQE